MVVLVPHELALELHEFNLLPVELARDAGGPVVGKCRKRSGEVDLHAAGYGQPNAAREGRALRQSSWLAWARQVKRLMLLPLWAVLLLVLAACQEPLVALSYWVQGYGWQTSHRAASGRELAVIG